MKLLPPLSEPPPNGTPVGLIARKFIVTQSFQTSKGVGDTVRAHAAVELLRPGNAIRPAESRRERPEVGEVTSLGAVQDREDLARGEVLGCERWDAIDLLEWKQGW